MEDSRGLYYNPQPSMPAVRVYVRRAEDGSIEFRMWDDEHPEVWEKHQWINMEVISMAAQLFSQEHDNSWQPTRIYDSTVAEALLIEQERALARQKTREEARARKQQQMQADK